MGTYSYNDAKCKTLNAKELFKGLNESVTQLCRFINACKEDERTAKDMAANIPLHEELLELYSEKEISNLDKLNNAVKEEMSTIEESAELLKSPNLTDDLENLKERAEIVCGVYSTIVFYDFKLAALLNGELVTLPGNPGTDESMVEYAKRIKLLTNLAPEFLSKVN